MLLPHLRNNLVLSSFALKSDLKSWQRNTLPETPKNFESILIPINYQHHWTLVVLIMKSNKALYYDSFAATPPPQLKQTIQTLLTSWTMGTFTWTNMIKRAIQTNGDIYSCGLFLLKFIQAVLLEQPINFTSTNMPELRAEFEEKLLSEVPTAEKR